MPLRRSSFLAPLLVLSICVPLLVSHHTLPLSTFYGEWASALGFVLVVALTLAVSRHEEQAGTGGFPLVALVPLWLIVMTMVGWAWRGHDITGSAAMTAIALLLATAVMMAGYRLRSAMSAQAAMDTVATALLVAGLLGTVAQWVQVFRLEPYSWQLVSEYFYDSNRRLWGNLNQPNHQATVHGLALAASVWLVSRGKLRVTPWLVAVALIETGVVLSGSRTGVLHVGIAALYALVAAWQARKAPRWAALMARPVGLVFAAAALVSLLMLMQPAIRNAGQVLGWQLFDTVAQLQAADQTSARQALWGHAWAMFRAHPWLGVGWGEFGWAQFQQLDRLGITVEMSLHAHNAVLDLLAKTGVAGSAGVIVGLAWWFWRVVRCRLWRAAEEETASAALALTWLAMLCGHSMLEYPLHYLYFLLPFCLLLGWLEPAALTLPMQRGTGRAAVAVFVAVAAVVLAVLWQDYRRVEAAEYAERGAETRLPLPRLLLRPYAMANLAERAELAPENASRWLEPHIRAVHLLPTPTMIGRTAWLFALQGDEQEARRWLERLRFYYSGDEAAQLGRVARFCQQTQAAARPEAFCAWVSRQAVR
ncbi:PglL family O-oligosaccharyltransferase [Cupriavidus sp. AU9028]|uniref:PglL family O-oligosaccharyltransferase n=1 Tax=Cupriavidus sp. AU9028 TaxID=2871157 RepID=UPI001C938D6E|nr:O-antigen ligase family protein [Cupriavidus sp. AU9028]MBY4895438.1 Wzy polymerase domain-containing protein [Cupriavidus sp. AU9028]